MTDRLRFQGRLGVIGTMVWDTIHRAERGATPPVREQWGGIAYSLAALAATCPPAWRWIPIVKLGEDLAAEAAGYIGALPGGELGTGLRTVPRPMNRVELRYRDAAERTERLSGGVPGWTRDELAPLLDGLDALYVNFISGFELDLDTARWLREHFAGPLYADLHSLFLGPAGIAARQPRSLPRWREWLACFDAVQLNEVELSLLTGGDTSRAGAARLVRFGPSLVLCTRGAAGVEVHHTDEPFPHRAPAGGEASVRSALVPPPGGAADGDPTGCGDVFGAACFAALLKGSPPEGAAAGAQALAVRKIRFPETATLAARLAEVAAP